jgi:ElaB/YqjD/DUF883 family membrane-anchored ribosome-binding protein
MDAATNKDAVMEQLVRDVRAVIADAEELLNATAGQAGERITAARARIEERLKASREQLTDLERGLVDKTTAAAEAVDHLVHEHPWPAMGVAAAIGFVLGLLTSRRG